MSSPTQRLSGSWAQVPSGLASPQGGLGNPFSHLPRVQRPKFSTRKQSPHSSQSQRRLLVAFSQAKAVLYKSPLPRRSDRLDPKILRIAGGRRRPGVMRFLCKKSKHFLFKDALVRDVVCGRPVSSKR